MSGDSIAAHYSFGGLRDRISAGIAAGGGEVTVDSLGAVDEFHVGGRVATARLIDQLALTADDHVLDIGSGLGGTARYIASQTAAQVTGIDLTLEYVEVATWLTTEVGLGDQIEFVHGTAADLPDNLGAFTAATMVHVGMNIAGKQSVFEQVASVLEPGAVFAIYDVMLTGETQPDFPTPWAASAETSAVESPSAYSEYLEQAGFAVDSVTDQTDAAIVAFDQLGAGASGGPPPLGLHLVMGPTTPTKIGNLVAAIKGGIVAPTEIVARRV